MLRVLVTKDQILIYLFHQQSKGKGSVRRDEESSRVTYYWISFATILWKNLKFFCVFIHFINRESKNNRWNQVTFHVEFFPTHDMFPIGKSISYIDKQLDHMLVFFFLIQSWMWCLCLPIWIWQVSCIVCRDVFRGGVCHERQAGWSFQVLSVLDSPPSESFDKHSRAEGTEC